MNIKDFVDKVKDKRIELCGPHVVEGSGYFTPDGGYSEDFRMMHGVLHMEGEGLDKYIHTSVHDGFDPDIQGSFWRFVEPDILDYVGKAMPDNRIPITSEEIQDRLLALEAKFDKIAKLLGE